MGVIDFLFSVLLLDPATFLHKCPTENFTIFYRVFKYVSPIDYVNTLSLHHSPTPDHYPALATLTMSVYTTFFACQDVDDMARFEI